MLARRPDAAQSIDSGAIINYVSVDVQRLMDAVTSLHQLWSLPVQVSNIGY